MCLIQPWSFCMEHWSRAEHKIVHVLFNNQKQNGNLESKHKWIVPPSTGIYLMSLNQKQNFSCFINQKLFLARNKRNSNRKSQWKMTVLTKIYRTRWKNCSYSFLNYLYIGFSNDTRFNIRNVILTGIFCCCLKLHLSPVSQISFVTNLSVWLYLIMKKKVEFFVIC